MMPRNVLGDRRIGDRLPSVIFDSGSSVFWMSTLVGERAANGNIETGKIYSIWPHMLSISVAFRSANAIDANKGESLLSRNFCHQQWVKLNAKSNVGVQKNATLLDAPKTRKIVS